MATNNPVLDGAVDGVVSAIGQKRSALKVLMRALSDEFRDLAIVVIDRHNDSAIYGIEYIEEQEALLEE